MPECRKARGKQLIFMKFINEWVGTDEMELAIVRRRCRHDNDQFSEMAMDCDRPHAEVPA
jgi:hypothetical protein